MSYRKELQLQKAYIFNNQLLNHIIKDVHMVSVKHCASGMALLVIVQILNRSDGSDLKAWLPQGNTNKGERKERENLEDV